MERNRAVTERGAGSVEYVGLLVVLALLVVALMSPEVHESLVGRLSDSVCRVTQRGCEPTMFMSASTCRGTRGDCVPTAFEDAVQDLTSGASGQDGRADVDGVATYIERVLEPGEALQDADLTYLTTIVEAVPADQRDALVAAVGDQSLRRWMREATAGDADGQLDELAFWQPSQREQERLFDLLLPNLSQAQRERLRLAASAP